MKIDLPVISPADLKEGWPGQFQIFSWYNFVINIPTAVFMVTTVKENGLGNIQLNAWGMLIGSGAEPKFLMQVMNNSDTRRLIERNREFVINFPSLDLKEKWIKTSEHFTPETDEILASGFTPEKSSVVKTPRIKECYAHYECILEWMREVETEQKVNTLIQGKIVHAVLDEAYLARDPATMYQKRSIPYHFSEFYDHPGRTTHGMGGFANLDWHGIHE